MPSHNCTKEGEVARLTESLKVAHHRIDDLEKQGDLLMELVTTVRVIAEQMTTINEKVSNNTVLIDEQRKTINEMREAPVNELNAYRRAFVIAILTSAVTSLVGVFIAKSF